MKRKGDDLSGRVALITGASSGIGAATAELLASCGVRLGLSGRDEGRLREVANRCRGPRAEVAILPADLLDAGAPAALVHRCVEWAGELHAVVSSAGGARFRSVARLDDSDLAAGLRLNFEAPLELARAALPYLRQHPRSHLIFVNTVAAREPTPPRGGAYLPGKAASLVLAEALFAEERDGGVAVTSILPDLTDTPLVPEGVVVDRDRLIRPSTVARAIWSALTCPPDACITELHLRPQLSLVRVPAP